MNICDLDYAICMIQIAYLINLNARLVEMEITLLQGRIIVSSTFMIDMEEPITV